MEEEIKPKIINILESLNKNYSKLIKYQKEKLDCVLNSKTFSSAKEKGYEKIVNDILTSAKDGDVEELQSVLESQVKSLILTTSSSADDEEITVATLLRDVKDAHKRTAAHFAALRGEVGCLCVLNELTMGVSIPPIDAVNGARFPPPTRPCTDYHGTTGDNFQQWGKCCLWYWQMTGDAWDGARASWRQEYQKWRRHFLSKK